MKYLNFYLFIGFFYVLHVFDSAFCTESIYEKISSHIQDSEIVDPHSLYYNRNTKTIKIPKNHQDVDTEGSTAIVSGEDDLYQLHCKGNAYEVFVRRLINILILKSKFKIKNEMAVGQLELEATIEELDILKRFGEGKVSIRQIDGIISNVIRSTHTSLFHEALNYTDILSMYIYQHRIMFGTIMLSILVVLTALKIQWTRLKIIFLLFDIMIIISFVLTWWELLQEAEIKLTAQQTIYSKIPDECRQQNMNFVNSMLWSFGFGNGDCLKYYEAIMTDPVLKVTPLHAFSQMCSKFFLYPLSLFGRSLSEFVEHITSSLPVSVRWLAKLILVVFLPALIGVLSIIFLGGSMGLRVGPFFHVYLHGRQSTPPASSVANNDRQAIEVIRSDTSETCAISSTEKKAIKSSKKESPKKIMATIQSDKDSHEKYKKQEESDTNSDEFPEENEYEKVSRTKLEDEMTQLTINDTDTIGQKDSKKETMQNVNIKELRKRNKTSIEIGSGDS